MSTQWFMRFGIFFLPKNIFGWMILLCAAVYSVYKFIDIDNRSHSVSDTLMNFAFNFLIIWAVYSLIGFILTIKKN